MKCDHGYSGVVKNWKINNCMEYDSVNEVCLKCLNEYELAGNSLSCTPLTVINNCKWYKENLS